MDTRHTNPSLLQASLAADVGIVHAPSIQPAFLPPYNTTNTHISVTV